jgi:hypothetical protein
LHEHPDQAGAEAGASGKALGFTATIVGDHQEAALAYPAHFNRYGTCISTPLGNHGRALTAQGRSGAKSVLDGVGDQLVSDQSRGDGRVDIQPQVFNLFIALFQQQVLAVIVAQTFRFHHLLFLEEAALPWLLSGVEMQGEIGPFPGQDLFSLFVGQAQGENQHLGDHPELEVEDEKGGKATRLSTESRATMLMAAMPATMK